MTKTKVCRCWQLKVLTIRMRVDGNICWVKFIKFF